MPGFEGLALDDALVFTNEYKDFSFVPLARTLAAIARRHCGPKDLSVLELGCGSGQMRRFLRVFGVTRYLGIDANPVAFRHSPHIQENPGHFRLLDLQQEMDFKTTFDIVCTFEVLEHIREDKLDNLLASIRRHMAPKSLFLGTASLQDCYDVHVTVHDRGWWLDRFQKHGLRPCDRHLDYEQWLTRNHPFNWDETNTNVFALELAES